jgi:hypothetical protein
MPRAKPGNRNAGRATYQVASAETVAPAAAPSASADAPPRPPMPVGNTPVSNTDGKPQTPADIINARGFWDALPAPKQATPAQVASISARQALANALAGNDPQATSSIDSSFQALAYAPPTSNQTNDRPVVTASAPMPRSARPSSAARNPMAVNAITTVVAKGLRGYPGVSLATRLAAAVQRDNDVWMRVLILAPSASTAMTASFMGEPDVTSVRAHFVKPHAAVAMTFGEDPMLGMATDNFSGAAVTRLTTVSFVTRTAALR